MNSAILTQLLAFVASDLDMLQNLGYFRSIQSIFEKTLKSTYTVYTLKLKIDICWLETRHKILVTVPRLPANCFALKQCYQHGEHRLFLTALFLVPSMHHHCVFPNFSEDSAFLVILICFLRRFFPITTLKYFGVSQGCFPFAFMNVICVHVHIVHRFT